MQHKVTNNNRTSNLITGGSGSIFVKAMGACVVYLMSMSLIQAAEFIPLGHRSGCDKSDAKDVSDDGKVAVGQCNGGARWTAETGWVALGNLPSGRSPRGATGVSVDGSVVVGDAQTGLGALESYRWTLAGGMEGLGTLKDNEAQGVSADGSVVVGRGSIQSKYQAYRWTEASGRVGVGGCCDCCSEASGVSADGSAVVGRGPSPSGFEAFLWTNESGVVWRGELPGGDFDSGARGVSADGNVIVGQSNSTLGREAFLWTSEGGIVGLGDLPGGDFRSRANAVSADGSVVVGQGRTGSNDDPTITAAGGSVLAGRIKSTEPVEEGFIWTQADGLQRLQDVLEADGTTGISGWSKLKAEGISDNGKWIAGYGDNPSGFQEAFLVRLPASITGPFKINAGLSGSWFNLDQAGHGLNVEVLDETRTVVYWYTYHTDGTPMFLYMDGTNDGNSITGRTYYSTGMKFGEFNTEDWELTVWGTTTVTFHDCDNATIEYSGDDPAYGSGTIPMIRLTSVSDLPCAD